MRRLCTECNKWSTAMYVGGRCWNCRHAEEDRLNFKHVRWLATKILPGYIPRKEIDELNNTKSF